MKELNCYRPFSDFFNPQDGIPYLSPYRTMSERTIGEWPVSLRQQLDMCLFAFYCPFCCLTGGLSVETLLVESS